LASANAPAQIGLGGGALRRPLDGVAVLPAEDRQGLHALRGVVHVRQERLAGGDTQGFAHGLDLGGVEVSSLELRFHDLDLGGVEVGGLELRLHDLDLLPPFAREVGRLVERLPQAGELAVGVVLGEARHHRHGLAWAVPAEVPERRSPSRRRGRRPPSLRRFGRQTGGTGSARPPQPPRGGRPGTGPSSAA
jgi:hypothetical protein